MIRIGEIDDADAGIEVGEPRELVLEPIDAPVDRLGGLMRPEPASLRTEISNGHLPHRHGEWLRLSGDVEHVRTRAYPARTWRHVGRPARLVHHERILARQRRGA